MNSNTPPDFFAILEALESHGVEFILVRGLCAVVHGAPIVTTDVDIVHCRSAENIERLVRALTELKAIHRYHPAKIRPNSSHLAGTGHSLLHTTQGRLDVLGSIDEGRDYDALLKDTVKRELRGKQYTLLSLSELIEIKARAGRDKDNAVLPILRSTLKLLQEQL